MNFEEKDYNHLIRYIETFDADAVIFNNLFLCFIKQFAFIKTDVITYRLKTNFRVLMDLHRYSIQNSKNVEQYLNDLKFYSQAIFACREDCDVLKEFLNHAQFQDNIKNF